MVTTDLNMHDTVLITKLRKNNIISEIQKPSKLTRISRKCAVGAAEKSVSGRVPRVQIPYRTPPGGGGVSRRIYDFKHFERKSYNFKAYERIFRPVCPCSGKVTRRANSEEKHSEN